MLLPGLHENVASSVARFSSLFKFRPIVSPLTQPRKRGADGGYWSDANAATETADCEL
jgi:hypothetical protein